MSFDDIPLCDVFHPTAQEFSNFEAYVEKTSKQAKSGIFKVCKFFKKSR
jgi:hypothetical protein